MNKLTAFISKKVHGVKVATRVAKVNTSLNVIETNAKDSLADIEIKIQSCMSELADTKSVNDIISRISDLYNEKEVQEKTLKRVEQIRNMFNEDYTDEDYTDETFNAE